MTSAETISQIKDIVLIVFFMFSLVVLIFATIFSLRLYMRVNRFMDRMESVADGFEETFGRLTVARQAMEDAATILGPVAKGLGLVGVIQGIGRLFGGDKSKKNGLDDKRER